MQMAIHQLTATSTVNSSWQGFEVWLSRCGALADLTSKSQFVLSGPVLVQRKMESELRAFRVIDELDVHLGMKTVRGRHMAGPGHFRPGP